MSLTIQELFEQLNQAFPAPSEAASGADGDSAASGENPDPDAQPQASAGAPTAAASVPAGEAGGTAAAATPTTQPAPEAAATPSVPAPAPPPPPVQQVDYAAKGYHLDVTVAPDQVVSCAELLDRNEFAIDAVTGMDWMAEGQMEVVYDFFHPLAGLRVVVRTRIPRDQPEIQTISKVFPGANWHERETHDFFGIQFLGHPDLSPFLLPEDADYHPLRKDFAAQ